MNQLKPINENELASLKQAIIETYVGHIISAKHGIVRIGDIKNEISQLERKITDLEGKSHIDFMQQTIQGLIKENKDKIETNAQLLEDIYAEVNASEDPRSMLNLKTLEIQLAGATMVYKTLSLKQQNETSQDLAEIIGRSVNTLHGQVKGLELMIALMQD